MLNASKNRVLGEEKPDAIVLKELPETMSIRCELARSVSQLLDGCSSGERSSYGFARTAKMLILDKDKDISHF